MEAVVSTPAGRLQGEKAAQGLVFRGIPFAAPPVGPLRFCPPEPVATWQGVRAAREFGNASLQLKGMMADIKTSAEDCLYLNVWTPGLDNRRRPVLVWLHGGGFATGAGSQVLYDGVALSQRGDLVVVTCNYRLGALGFLDLTQHLRGERSVAANNGIRDQVAVLRWVRDNVEAFGGDPQNVTIAGESAGGMCVGTLLASPLARGLFHRAIAQSGAAHHAVDRSEAGRMTDVFLEAAGVTPAGLASLWDLSEEQILTAQRACAKQTVVRGPVGRQLPQGAMTLIPSVDEDVLPAQPHTLIASGQGAHVPLLAGTTRDEWNFFVLLTDPKRLTLDAAGLHKVFARRIPGRGEEVLAVYTAGLPGDEVPWKVFAAMETDRMFRIPSIRMAEAHARHAPAFMYRLDYGSPLFDGELGACHAIDIPFMFDAVQSKAGVALTGGGEAAAQLAGRMADAWAAFARDGAPGHEGLPDWPAYECSGRATLVLNETCELVQDPMGAERQVWDQIQ